MVACELALALAAQVSHLVLIDPVGLWRDDLPVRNWMILSEAAKRAALFVEPDADAARRFFSLPDADAQANFIWSQACTGKFVWPIPDRGLKNRIHRIGVPTLIVWGAQDNLVAPAYASEFERAITGSRVELIAGAGHLPHLEQPETVATLVATFLNMGGGEAIAP
jgi:pimeloyl-ACP methyl ester carboxylesterase